MTSIQDERGYNQGFKPSKSLTIRTARRVDYIIDQFDKKDNVRILEIGCGTGEFSYLVASKLKADVLGSDISPYFIEKASAMYQLSNLKFEVLDFNSPQKISEMKFDYIIGNGILHHLYYNIDESLQNLKLLLKSDGKIIFLEPNIYNPYCLLIFKIPLLRKLANLEPDEMAFSRGFIKKKLGFKDFKSIKVEFKDFLLPNTPEFLINFIIFAGNILEKIPFTRIFSQSIYISAINK